MSLRIRWAALQNNAALRATLRQSLKKDVATNLGVAETDIVNDTIIENTDIQVSTDIAAAGRHFAAQASTGCGITYQFEIQTTDEAKTSAAGATFDALVAKNDFAMTQTSSTISTECPASCVQPGSRTLVAARASPPDNAPPRADGSTIGIVVGSVVGVVSIVLIVGFVVFRKKKSSPRAAIDDAGASMLLDKKDSDDVAVEEMLGAIERFGGSQVQRPGDLQEE